MRMIGKVISAVALVLLIGLGFYGYQLYTATKQIQVTEVSIASPDLRGWPIPSRIRLELDFYVENPTPFDVELERLSYKVYVNDRFVAEGVKGYVLIPANSATPIRIPLEITALDVLKAMASQIMEGKRDVKVDVRGMADVPIKLFGIVRIVSISVPFEVSRTYTLPGPGISGGGSIVTTIEISPL